MACCRTVRFGLIIAAIMVGAANSRRDRCLAAEAKAAVKSPVVYAPVGAPADPKVSAAWNRFYSHAQATELLQKLVKAHPERAKLQSLGKSYGGREMWVMTITDFARDKEVDKSGFWIDGGIHANETQATEVVLYTAWYLLEMHGHNAFVDGLLRDRVFYLMPMMSPDSRDAHMTRPNTTHSPRTGQRPVDDDKDGLVDEDGFDDLDGDGHITQMRVKDPNGRFKPHPEYPNLMISAEPDERGSYSLLGVEGIDNDGDGRVNEDGDGSYDPNRDWGWNWQPGYVQNGAHHYPFSILENRMVAEFIMAHRNIGGAQSYHNTGGMLLRGPGAKDDQYEAQDVTVYNVIGKKGEQMLPGYKYLNIAQELYEVYGGEVDWLYGTQGVFTFTNEMFTPFNLFRKASDSGYFSKAEDLHAFDKLLLFGDGVVPWKEVNHPVLGKIEVGGFKKNWSRQPPSFLIEEECHRNMAFTLYHADQLPLVKIQSVETRDLGESLFEVTAVVSNERISPTHAAVDVKHKLTGPDRLTIEGRDLKVLTALVSDEPFFLKPNEQRRKPSEVRLDNLPGMRARYVRWIVQGKGPYTFHLRSTKGGSDRLEK